MNDGQSFIAMIRNIIAKGMYHERLRHNQHSEIMLFQLKQWEEVEKLLVERGA
jgi:hypothetical protein